MSSKETGGGFAFFITALKMISVISPASMYPEPVCKIKDKWKLSEDLFACSHALCNVWRRKWYCLQWNNTGSIETEELWFYSSSVPSHKQLQAIDVFFCATIVIRHSIRGREEDAFESKSTSRTGSMRWWPCVFTQPSSGRSSLYIYRMNELVNRHAQKQQ